MDDVRIVIDLTDQFAAALAAALAPVRDEIAALAARVAALEPGPGPEPEPPPPPLRLDLAFADGRTLAFSEADGEDMGDFAGPGFVQRCIRVDQPSGPLTVFFRPDRGSDRAEVVVELGRLWGPATAVVPDLGAYRATIRRGDAVLAEVDVPKHWWFSRWRWQSAPRPVVRTTADLAAAGLVPAFDPELVARCEPTRSVTYLGPMDAAGVYRGMLAGGDRPDIGLFTEWQSEYLATGRPEALASLLAQAEAAGSIPWNLRDERASTPVDFERNPTASWTGAVTVPGYINIRQAVSEWKIDVPHYPSLGYLPFLLTGDPYHLETVQFAASYAIGYQVGFRKTLGSPLLIGTGETRGYAWGLREAVGAAAATPEDVPRWLLPRAYWGRVLDANLAWLLGAFVRAPASDTDSTVFRQATDRVNKYPGMLIMIPFEEGYLMMVVAHAVRAGFAAWREFLGWKAGAAVALADGTSGWPRQVPQPYQLPLRRPDGTPVTTWADAWENYRADPASKVPADFVPEVDPPWPQLGPIDYWTRLETAWAGLASARSVGTPGVSGATANVRELLDGVLRDPAKKVNYRWSVAG